MWLLRARKKTPSKHATGLSKDIGRRIRNRDAGRTFAELGLKSSKGRENPLLSEYNKKNRFEWARRCRHYTGQDWFWFGWILFSSPNMFNAVICSVRNTFGQGYSYLNLC